MPHSELDFMLSLADAADKISTKWFRSKDLPVEAKPDDTPVSIADREVEEKLRKMIAKKHSDSGIIGEEFGVYEASNGGTRFIIDPIDGTKNYVRGVPVWATLIALECDGAYEVGVVSAPALGYRWWGVRGVGAWRNGDEIHVSDTATIEDAFLSSDSYTTFEKRHSGPANWNALTKRVARSRGFGDFWSHMLVAEGAIDIAVEPEVTLWDLAASSVIVEAAGGRFTDLFGNPGPGGGSVIATNGVLHDAVVGALNA